MDIFRLEAWEKEFPELKIIFHDYLKLTRADLQEASIQIRVQRLDRESLQTSPVVKEVGSQLELFLVDRLPLRGLRVRDVRIRPTIVQQTDKNQPPVALVKGAPIFYILNEIGKLDHVIRVIFVALNLAKIPVSIRVEIEKIPQNISLGNYIKQLRREAKQALLKEVQASEKEVKASETRN